MAIVLQPPVTYVVTVQSSPSELVNNTIDPPADLGSPTTLLTTVNLYAAHLLGSGVWNSTNGLVLKLYTSPVDSAQFSTWTEVGSINLTYLLSGLPSAKTEMFTINKSTPDTLGRFYRWSLEGSLSSGAPDTAIVSLSVFVDGQ